MSREFQKKEIGTERVVEGSSRKSFAKRKEKKNKKEDGRTRVVVQVELYTEMSKGVWV